MSNNNEIRLPDGLDIETATDVLREFASTDDATIVSSDELDALQAEISEAKDAFAAVLSEQSPQSEDTLARQDMDALTEPFRDDDGAIDVDTLRQEPETQSGGGADPSDDDPADADGVELDSLEQRDELNTLRRKRNSFDKRGVGPAVERIESEMCEIAGVDEYDTLAAEVFDE